MAQVKDTYNCFKVLAKDGLSISEGVIEKLSVDKEKWQAEYDALHIIGLEEGDLEMSPPPPPRSCSRDVPTAFPPGVNQHGSNAGVISPDDVADLRNQPTS